MTETELQNTTLFVITNRPFKSTISRTPDSTDAYLDNWPMLYILVNEEKKLAYIGESIHVRQRMIQHLNSEKKDMFSTTHFIYSPQFNQSVTFDFESKLIQYFLADEQYRITNSNEGIADVNYYQRKKYDKTFKELWAELIRNKLAKNTIDELETRDIFKYSPFKELNPEQWDVFVQVRQAIVAKKRECVVITGIPGSGKTIMAVYLMKFLRDKYPQLSIGLIEPMSSLRKTMQGIFKKIYGLKARDVLSPSDVVKNKYNILLVDETHRLRQYKNISWRGKFKENCMALGLTTESDELDWILQQADRVILFYDQLQVINPAGIDLARFTQKMNADKEARPHLNFQLNSEMRVLGGTGYIRHIGEILDGKAIEPLRMDTYQFKLITSFKKFNRMLYEKEEEYHLCRMGAGYAWDWISKKDSSLYDIEIEGIRKRWNTTNDDWIGSKNSINEVGCIHTLQGYDLNYGFIILGSEIGYDTESKKIIVRRENYYDKNGKIGASYEELLQYIKSIYYVLLTRGIKGTYLYVCDPELRKYMSTVVETE